MNWNERVPGNQLNKTTAIVQYRHGRAFRIGFWLLMLSWPATALIKTRWHINGVYLSAPMLSIGMGILLYLAIKSWNDFKRNTASYYRLLLALLLVCGVVAILRDFSELNIRLVRDSFGIRYYAWAWLMPAFMVLPASIAFIAEMLKTMANQALWGLFVVGVFPLPPINWMTTLQLTWGGSALTLFWPHLTKWSKRVALTAGFITILFAIFGSERNAIIGHGFLMMMASLIILFRRNAWSGRTKFGVVILYTLVLGLIYYGAYNTEWWILSDRSETKIEAFKEELFQNTRVSKSGVSLYQDFFDDLTWFDLMVGRGATGVYRSMESGGIYRPIIECGYCQVILKGGLIMLILMLLLAVPALVKGLFDSRNWLVKGFALVIAGWLVEMLPYGVPAAFPRYFIFWVAVGVCLNRRLRYLSDKEILNYIPIASIALKSKRSH